MTAAVVISAGNGAVVGDAVCSYFVVSEEGTGAELLVRSAKTGINIIDGDATTRPIGGVAAIERPVNLIDAVKSYLVRDGLTLTITQRAKDIRLYVLHSRIIAERNCRSFTWQFHAKTSQDRSVNR